MKRRLVNYSFLGLGGVFLCVYPFVFIADIMTLAGEWSGNEGLGLVIIVLSFVLVSGLYPIVYLFTLILYLFKKRLRKTFVTSIPCIHVLVVMGLGCLWYILGKA